METFGKEMVRFVAGFASVFDVEHKVIGCYSQTEFV